MATTDMCRCCLLRPSTKELKTPNKHFGTTEILLDMLENCFQMQMTLDHDKSGICYICLNRLRDAHDFKVLVQRSQKELMKQMGLIPDDPPPEPEPAEETSELPIKEEPIKTETETAEVHTCEICQATFDDEIKLVVHMEENHDNGPEYPFWKEHYRCDICGDQFDLQLDYLRHIHKHLRNVPYRDILIEEYFLPKDRSKKRAFHKKFSCKYCSKTFPTKSHLLEHKAKYRHKKYNCQTCTKGFNVKRNLEIHERICGSSAKFTCNVCEKQFAEKKTLEIHIRTHTGHMSFGCDFCSKKFSHKPTLMQHLRGKYCRVMPVCERADVAIVT